jgi:hypothetical protein
MECPNDDPYFTRMMYRMGLLKKGMKAREIVNVRRNTYYSICIIVRFVLIMIVYFLQRSIVVRGLVLVGAVVSIFNFSKRIEGHQWWSKKFQLMMAIIIALLVILSFVGKVNTWTIPAAMSFSLLVGILQSFYVGFC